MSDYYTLQPGNPDNLDRVTGRALFTPTGETGAIDLGDVKLHEFAAEVRRRPVVRAGRYGLIERGNDVVAVTGISYRLELQEALAENLRTVLFAEPLTMIEQGAQASTPVAFADVVKGRVYDLELLHITSCVVTVNGELCVAGRDYELDDMDGTLRILPHGIIRAGSTVVATVSTLPIRTHRIKALAATAPLQRRGAMKIVERDGRWTDYTAGPLPRVITFPCTLSRDADEARESSTMAGHSLLAVPTGPLVIHTRSVAELRRVARAQVVTVGTSHRQIGSLHIEGSFCIR
jgi:hypothetical protein